MLAGGLMWLEPWDERAPGGGATALPGPFPSFVMELETIRDGRVDTTIVLTYASDDEWLWEVFDTEGSLLSSQRLESGRLTITHAPLVWSTQRGCSATRRMVPRSRVGSSAPLPPEVAAAAASVPSRHSSGNW